MASSPPETAFDFTGASTGTVASGAMSAMLATPNATQFNDTPLNEYYSPNASIMANAWQLPANLGSLRLSSGQTTQKPITPKDRTYLSQAVQMLDLYGKFESGQPLTHAEMVAASELGSPEIAHAAQLMTQKGKKVVTKAAQKGGEMVGLQYGPDGTVTQATPTKTPPEPAQTKTVRPKGEQAARLAANNIIADRLEATVGISREDLTKKGLAAQVPKQFAAIMQNAGYGVTQQMSLSDALSAAQGQGPQGTPSNFASSGLTVQQYLQSMSHMTKAQLYTLQQSLFNGGFYDPTYTDGSKSYVHGVLDVGTVEAMRSAILQTLEQNASGNKVSLEQVISQGQSGNNTLGGQGALLANKNATVPMASMTQTQEPLINAFVKLLGRAPSQAELDAFTAQYNQELQNSSKTLTLAGENAQGIVDYQSGIPFVQGTPTVSVAADQYAENTDPTEYQAHNVADAFGMLMNLVDRQGTSALDTPGTRPTGTT